MNTPPLQPVLANSAPRRPLQQPRALDARTPVLFLPVNVETRFVDTAPSTDLAKGRSELWVRIYPDQLAIDSHEPELTDQEIADGKTYWDSVWRAGKLPTSLDAVKAPWRGLASLYGPRRAAWIALQLTPTNLAQQPQDPSQPGTDPNPLPIYPTPVTRMSSWTRPALAKALPDAWTVVTVSGAQTAQFRGAPVSANLAVGLTPGGGVFPPASPVDPGMKWLVDFETAVTAGMALKIALTPEERASGFDRIFVFGLRTQDNSGSDTFSALLDCHHYTDGFSIVPQGAPTNNTPDASSAYSRKDTDYEISFAVERQDPLTQDAECDGNVFARLVGIDPSHMAHVGYSEAMGARNGKDMLTVLWPATIGYFLSQMMYNVFTPEQIETARQYGLANAIPRGPVPAFRVGKTPYGVMPVTSLRRYRPHEDVAGGSIEPALVEFVLRLWPTWLASAGTAPHMDKTGDPDKEFVNLLGMDASSMTFRGRQVLGDEFMWNYINFMGVPIPIMNTWWIEHLVQGRQVLDTYGFNQWDPRVIHLALAGGGFPVGLPTVQAGTLSETDPLKADADLGGGKTGNYIQWLKQASITDLQADNYPGPKPTSMLYTILRQCAILDYVVLATIAEIGAGRLQLSQIREAEIIGVAPAAAAQAPPVSVWEVLARPSLPNPQLSWADYLVSLDPAPQSAFARLADFRASLDRLSTLPTAELDRLVTETLDACSHRLDVWASAVANAILNRTRELKNTEVHVGGFGWVEEVRPAATRARIQGSELERVRALDEMRARLLKTPPVMPAPVQPLEDNGGFVYAPSLAQASVAAVLRNGYMTHKGSSEEGLLSIDLSSERVRRALLLMDGIRQGQSLNALLGYLFETGAHALQLDKYIQPFRDRFPVVANKLTPSSDPSESVAASNVVDGLALRTAWDTGQLAAGQDWGTGLPGPGADQKSIIGVLQTLDDYADALGDLSMSETVFQVMRGNFATAGTLMDAISKGARPPQPEVVNTPRGGLDLTHRVSLLLAGSPAASPAWSGVPKRPRAAAEPWLDAWLSRLLPDPASVICEVHYDTPAGSRVKRLTLADLKVGTLDCIAMADAAEVPQKSELEYRIMYAAALPSNADSVQIEFQPAAPPPGAVFFPDFFYLVKCLRAVIGSGRALMPQDLTLPEKKAQDLGGSVDLTELSTRAAAAMASLSHDVNALAAAIAGLPGATGPVRDALFRCSFYGALGSFPYTSSDPDPGLADQASSILKILQARSSKASAVNPATAPLADLLGVFATIFDKGLVILPRFTPPDVTSLHLAFGQSTSLVASDAQAPARWLMQLTQVRPAIFRLDAGLSLARVLGAADDTAARLMLGQLPSAAGDRWLGLPIDPAKPPPKGRVAFACITQGDPLNEDTYAGLLIDEWPERIPSTKETAAVAFHYEEPKARAPQSLLLALCPDATEVWNEELVIAILQETLELAKIRTVDLDSVQQVGQILPALYFPVNLKGATASANFALKESIRAASITGQ